MIGRRTFSKRAFLCIAGALLLASPGARAAEPTDPVTRAYKIEIAGLKDSGKTPPPWSKQSRDALFSARLAALFARDDKYQEEAEGVGLLDWDPFINGQDGEVKSLSVKIVSRGADKGVVAAAFTSFGKRQSVMFDVVQERGAWRIDEIRPLGEKGKRLSIVSILSEKHECGSETGKKC